jgi:hypothetical protein
VFYNSTNPAAAMILFTIYEFIMNVLLLNIMIASMTSSFGKVTQVGGAWVAVTCYMTTGAHCLAGDEW